MAMGFAKESTSQEFMQMIAPIYYRRKREDVLKELPELIEEESWIEGGDAEMAAYEEAAFKEKFMTMRRVSFNVDDFELSGKLKRIKEIVRQAKFENRRVLVFSFFLETIKKVCAYLNDSCMEPITGAVPVSHRQEIIDAFEKSPAGTVLPLQINAGGTLCSNSKSKSLIRLPTSRCPGRRIWKSVLMKSRIFSRKKLSESVPRKGAFRQTKVLLQKTSGLEKKRMKK